MKLPNDEIGISDIIDYRECPERFAWSMQRHEPMPDELKIEEGEKAEPPEKRNWTNAYGSAVHDLLELAEHSHATDLELIQEVWVEWGPWLEPTDIERMTDDLETWRTRSQLGYRLIGTEIEIRVPLMKYEGRTIFFRGRVDALYQSIENSGVFLSRDYKSSRWPKSHEEILKDLQQWAYNWGIHEFYPECEDLTQLYDQLRYGQEPIHKTAEQRAQVKQWLQTQVTAILRDEKLRPKQNQWCPYCPLVMQCRVPRMATDYFKDKLAVLAPEKKDGKKIVVELRGVDEADAEEHDPFEEYVAELRKMKPAMKTMERFVAEVESTLKAMPAERRAKYGFDLAKPRSRDTFPVEALRRLHERLGDDFYQLAGLSKKSVEEFYGKDAPETAEVFAMAERKQSAPSLKAAS